MKKILPILLLAFIFNLVDTKAQTNLLTNGGFETWVNSKNPGPIVVIPGTWTIPNPQQYVSQSTINPVVEGSKACRITVPANAGGAYTISQQITVIAGKTYSFRASYYIETGAGAGKDARIACNFKTAPNGTAITMSLEDSLALKGPGGANGFFPTVTGAWKTYTYDVTAPTGATTFVFSVSVAKGATVSWDNFSFAENTTPTIYKYTYTAATGYNYSPSITGLDYVTTGPSADQSFTVKAANLTTNLTITAPTNFEISATSGSSFYGQSSIQIPPSSGTVSPLAIYIRLKAGLASASYSGNVSLTSTGATTLTIPVSGYVGTLPPVITPSVTTLTGFSYAEGAGPSTQQSFTVSASLIPTNTNLTITAPANYEISAVSGSSFTSSMSLAATSGTLASTTIYVRLKAALSASSYTGNITLTAGATTQNISLTGAVNGITVSTTSLTGFSYGSGAGPSLVKSFTVSGTGLSTYLIVTGPTDFEISSTTGTSFASLGQYLIPAANASTATTIYVRMKAGLTAVSIYNENITVSSTGFTSKAVNLNGNVLSTTAIENASASDLKVYAGNNEIIVEGTANNETVSVYNMVGMQLRLVQSKGDKLVIPVQSGSVYLVRTATKTIKVII